VGSRRSAQAKGHAGGLGGRSHGSEGSLKPGASLQSSGSRRKGGSTNRETSPAAGDRGLGGGTGGGLGGDVSPECSFQHADSLPVQERSHGRQPSSLGGCGASLELSNTFTSFGAQAGSFANGPPAGIAGAVPQDPEPALDLDVTVLAFAQWLTELKSRQGTTGSQVRTEMSLIRNVVTSNATDLSDFKRHGAAIQSQMQMEINEVRDSLGSLFQEITAAVRTNSASDQELKSKIQNLNELAIRNEASFAQLADAADQSQSKLRGAVTEMQLSSEKMRVELTGLTSTVENLESIVYDRGERIASDMDLLGQDLQFQLDRRRDQFRRMVTDVASLGDVLRTLVDDLKSERQSVERSHAVTKEKLRQIAAALASSEAAVQPTTSTVSQRSAWPTGGTGQVQSVSKPVQRPSATPTAGLPLQVFQQVPSTSGTSTTVRASNAVTLPLTYR